jgi:pimeloyl-ACP methyl ester carboxylesterase/tellurite resistance protein
MNTLPAVGLFPSFPQMTPPVVAFPDPHELVRQYQEYWTDACQRAMSMLPAATYFPPFPQKTQSTPSFPMPNEVAQQWHQYWTDACQRTMSMLPAATYFPQITQPTTPQPTTPQLTTAQPFPLPNEIAQEWYEYWTDACQRTILTWDVLRKRGNIYFEHRESGKPPVLVFDYEMVLDAREFGERPVNYALVRILPPQDVLTDPKKRAFVIIDPRAGHGPGIGGSKSDSQIGMALRAGHPCYFVMFYPEPVAGQTILDIVDAESKFLAKVAELHPDADGQPFVIGNCQAGWSLMMVAASHPDKVGPILLAGSPLSYWAGVKGKNPMRYNGGLFGGSWLASLMSDLGNGRFDGALLVQNFEMLNPANTFLTKQYDLYSTVDTGAERFLDFEKWWGGVFLMNKEEMRFIVNELFVGNKLAIGEIEGGDGREIDLRNIRSPIIVFASWGDNITPPQQALNWIVQLYDSVEEIRANEQTIVYSLHDSVGHLGIFVSAKIAGRETDELFDALDLIDACPPGLYELVITDTQPDTPNLDLVGGRYLYRIEARTLDDLRAFDDGREDEAAFRAVKRLSETNEGLYDTLASPWIRAVSNETTAEALRATQPIRLQRSLLSDRNPLMQPVESMAELVRSKRAPARPDNFFLQWERLAAEGMEKWLNVYRDYRDFWVEASFTSFYESPLVESLAGLHGAGVKAAHQPHAAVREGFVAMKKALIEARMGKGRFIDALARVLMYQQVGSHFVAEERGFRLLQSLRQELPDADRPSLDELKRAFKDAAMMVAIDPERAISSLLEVLPDAQDRQRVVDMAWNMVSARGSFEPEREARLQHVAQALGVELRGPSSGPSVRPTKRAVKETQ